MKGKYFLYVGNAYPHKNLELLVEACSRVGDSQLIFVGKDDFFYRSLRENETVKQLAGRIVFKTDVTDKELVRLYHNARAAVFPSFMEGFALPALEALRQECPVIVSDVPVFHELLGDIPTYFDPHSVDSLVEKLKNPPSKPKNISKLLSRFSWKKMAAKTLEVYERVV